MSSALLVVDVQNDFCPGGALAVAGGADIVTPINQLMSNYDVIVLTQDWHPASHSSFASQHPSKEPFDTVEMPYGLQVLWPDHCVQGSEGAAFHADLDTQSAHAIVRKGYRPHVDSYSAFFENDHETQTGLDGFLKTLGVQEITMVGLATDFCVAFSALDAAKLGFSVTVREDLCRAIDLEGSLKRAADDMIAAGIRFVS